MGLHNSIILITPLITLILFNISYQFLVKCIKYAVSLKPISFNATVVAFV